MPSQVSRSVLSINASTLTNGIASVTAKVMVALLSGKDLTGVLYLLPSTDAAPTKEGAVVGAAGVDRVHVGHQNLPEKLLTRFFLIGVVLRFSRTILRMLYLVLQTT